MTDYVNVFGSDTVNPTRQNYVLLTLTANAVLNWPFNYTGDGHVLSAITDVSASSGLTITLPDANGVSKGEDVLVRNVGSNAFNLVDADSVAVATLDPGDAYYLFVSDNSDAAGAWEVVYFGVGTSSVDAATLAGYGLKASSNRLHQRHYVATSSVGLEINATYRSSVLIHTGGAVTYTLSAAATLGNDFFLSFRNNGTGTVTIDPSGSETIDSLTTLTIQPGESLIISCSGTQFYSIGHGRAVSWNFTQLIKDVSSGGTITLSATEASNKLLTFTGSPTADLTVVIPAVVDVFYVSNELSTDFSVTIKTSGGSGLAINQNERVIFLCDGTDVLFVQYNDASIAAALATEQAAIATAQAELATIQVGLAEEQVLLAEEQVLLAEEQVLLAEEQVALATDQAVLAENSAQASAASASAVAWVSGTTYAIGDARYSLIDFVTYRRKTNGAGTTDPSLDTTNWASVIPIFQDYQEFLSSGTWTKPANMAYVYVEAIGGGSSGSVLSSARGGGGGGFVAKTLLASDVDSTVTVSIGGGGLSSSGGMNAGGESSFGAHVIAKGGDNNGSAGGGEWFSTANTSVRAAGGYSSGAGGYREYSSGGNCVMGGAGGGGAGVTPSSGGVSQYGGNGGDGGSSVDGESGSPPGGGGGGAYTGHNSGAGGDGRVRVWCW